MELQNDAVSDIKYLAKLLTFRGHLKRFKGVTKI